VENLLTAALLCTLIGSPAGSQLKADKTSIVMARAAKSDMLCLLIINSEPLMFFKVSFSFDCLN